MKAPPGWPTKSQPCRPGLLFCPGCSGPIAAEPMTASFWRPRRRGQPRCDHLVPVLRRRKCPQTHIVIDSIRRLLRARSRPSLRCILTNPSIPTLAALAAPAFGNGPSILTTRNWLRRVKIQLHRPRRRAKREPSAPRVPGRCAEPQGRPFREQARQVAAWGLSRGLALRPRTATSRRFRFAEPYSFSAGGAVAHSTGGAPSRSSSASGVHQG